MMFSFSTCPFCLRAKQILEEDYGEQIEVYECDLESAFRQHSAAMCFKFYTSVGHSQNEIDMPFLLLEILMEGVLRY